MDIAVRFVLAAAKCDRLRLTTEHAASSYGQPVLVDDYTDQAYGPGDTIIGAPILTVPFGPDDAEAVVATRAWNARVKQARQV